MHSKKSKPGHKLSIPSKGSSRRVDVFCREASVAVLLQEGLDNIRRHLQAISYIGKGTQLEIRIPLSISKNTQKGER